MSGNPLSNRRQRELVESLRTLSRETAMREGEVKSKHRGEARAIDSWRESERRRVTGHFETALLTLQKQFADERERAFFDCESQGFDLYRREKREQDAARENYAESSREELRERGEENRTKAEEQFAAVKDQPSQARAVRSVVRTARQTPRRRRDRRPKNPCPPQVRSSIRKRLALKNDRAAAIFRQRCSRQARPSRDSRRRRAARLAAANGRQIPRRWLAATDRPLLARGPRLAGVAFSVSFDRLGFCGGGRRRRGCHRRRDPRRRTPFRQDANDFRDAELARRLELCRLAQSLALR